MGALTLDGRQIGDDGRCAVLSPALHAALDKSEAIQRERARNAMDRVLDGVSMQAQATRSAVATIKSRARFYQRRPQYLDMIPGLSAGSTPRQIIAVCGSLLEGRPADRFTGFGGELPRFNLKGARLYARWLRRVSRAAAAAATEAAW